MDIQVRLIAIVAAILAPVFSAFAEAKVEDLIFEDCHAAKVKAAELAPSERESLLELLPRVITLSTQAPAAPELLAQMPGQSRPGEPPAGIPWHTRDAKRELRGKRCAIELLEAAGASAASALPVLAEIYSKETLSDEVAVALEEAAATIAEQAHKQGLIPAEKDFERAARLLDSSKPLVARNFLHEYVGLSLPYVIRQLSLLDGADGQKVVGFLADADPDGSRSMRVFLDLLVWLPDEQQRRLARQIRIPSPAALQAFIPELSRLAADSSRSAAFMPLFGKVCLANDSLTIDSTVSAALAQQQSFGQLEAEEQKCLLRAVPGFSKQVALMLSSADPTEQSNGLALFAAAPKSFSSEQKAAAWGRMQELVMSSDAAVRRSALQIISSTADKRADAASSLAKILSQGDASEHGAPQSPRELALESLGSLPFSKETAKLAPLALSAIALDQPAPGAVAFLSKAEDADPGLLKLLAAKDPAAAGQALLVLRGMKTLPKKAIEPVFSLLSHPALSRNAELTLARLPAAQAAPLLKRSLPRAQEPARTAILSLSQSLGLASKAESAELLNALSAGGCTQLVDRSSAIEKLLARRDLDSEKQAALRDLSARCLTELPERDAKALLVGALAASIAQSPELPKAFTSGGLSDELQEQLMDLAISSSQTESPFALVAQQVISHGSRPTRIKLLASPRLKDASSGDVLQAIRDLAKNSGNDEQLRISAIRALAALGDQLFDWKEFVRGLIESAGQGNPIPEGSREVLKLLPAALVLESVMPALDSDDRNEVVGACRVGASLGSQAIPIVSKVWGLREKGDPAVKYAAALALLEINPLTPDLQDHVRRMLVNRYYPAALRSPIQWRNSVAVVELNPASFGTLRTVRLDRLLAPH